VTVLSGQIAPLIPLDVAQTRIRTDSNNPELQYQLALGYWTRRRWDDAERALQTMVSIQPRTAKGQLALAMIPFARRERLRGEVIDGNVPDNLKATVEASQSRMRLAFMIDPLVSQQVIGAVTPDPTRYFPPTEEAHEIRQQVFQWHEDFYQDRFGSSYSRVQLLIREAQWTRGRDKIPAYVRWIRGLAAAHIARFDSAIADIGVLYQRAVDHQQSDTIVHIPLRTNEYRYILGVLHRNAGSTDSAVSLFQAAAENDIGLFMAHVRLAEIYESVGDLDAAIRERRLAIASNPDEATLYYEAGVVLMKANLLDEALEMMVTASETNPRDPQSPFAAAVIQLSLGKAAEARESLVHFLRIAPSYLAPQIDRARQQLGALNAQSRAPPAEP
jgi:tetratricopeptide (TPR) repeat protein